MRFAVAAVALLLLAGCSSPDPEPTDPTPPEPPQAALGLLQVQELTTTGYGFEPSVEVAEDGTVYVTAAQGVTVQVPRASRLWYMPPGGNFTEVDPVGATGVSNLPAGAEGDLAVGHDGTVYYVDLTELAGTMVAASTDGGKNWMLRSANAFAVPGGDREWVAAGPDNQVAVTWNQLATGLWVARSSDGGLTFPQQTYVPGFRNTFAGGIDMAPDGTVYVARANDAGVHVIRVTDAAEVFLAKEGGQNAFIFPVPAVDAHGTVYVTWAGFDGENTNIYYAYSTDRAETWSAPIQISQGHATAMPWIDGGADGQIVLAYYGAKAGDVGNPNQVASDWSVHAVRVTQASTQPHILRTLMAEDIHSGSICTRGLSCNGGRNLGDYLQVAWAPEQVHVAWTTGDQNVFWGLAGLTQI
jgi:hypothetical protein